MTKTYTDKNGKFAAGNPGKPKGARHKATQAALALLDGEAEALTRQAVDMALAQSPQCRLFAPVPMTQPPP